MDKNDTNILLLSLFKGETSFIRNVSIFALGLLFLAWGAYKLYLKNPLQDFLPPLLIGFALSYSSGYRKKIYLSPEGLVKETASFFSVSRQSLPWTEIRHVTLMFRKNEMLGFFEQGIKGWKIPFEREQENTLRQILKKYIPNIEIDTQ